MRSFARLSQKSRVVLPLRSVPSSVLPVRGYAHPSYCRAEKHSSKKYKDAVKCIGRIVPVIYFLFQGDWSPRSCQHRLHTLIFCCHLSGCAIPDLLPAQIPKRAVLFHNAKWVQPANIKMCRVICRHILQQNGDLVHKEMLSFAVYPCIEIQIFFDTALFFTNIPVKRDHCFRRFLSFFAFFPNRCICFWR